LLFDATNEHGVELWRSDGAPSGTTLVRDIAPGRDVDGRPVSSDPSNFFEWRDLVLFSATDRYGRELWRTDGTAEGTRMLANIAAESVIEGRIQDTATGKPLAGVTIEVYANYLGQRRPFTEMTSDGEGRYRFDTLVPAEYQLRTRNAHGYLDRESVPIYLEAEATVVVDFALSLPRRRAVR
jgi:ELWxxDGT repeat protein